MDKYEQLEAARLRYRNIGMANIADKTFEQRCEISRAYYEAEREYFRLRAEVRDPSAASSSPIPSGSDAS